MTLRRRRGLLAGLAVAIALSLAIEKRREYCLLCGKDRWALSLGLLAWDFGTGEQETAFSHVLEPLVHPGEVPHKWCSIEAHLLVSWPVRWLNARFARSHAMIDMRRRRFEHLLQITAGRDSDLAVSLGQYVLSPRTQRSDDEELVMMLYAAGLGLASPPDERELQHVRQFLRAASVDNGME